VIFSNPDWQ